MYPKNYNKYDILKQKEKYNEMKVSFEQFFDILSTLKNLQPADIKNSKIVKIKEIPLVSFLLVSNEAIFVHKIKPIVSENYALSAAWHINTAFFWELELYIENNHYYCEQVGSKKDYEGNYILSQKKKMLRKIEDITGVQLIKNIPLLKKFKI